MAGSIAWRAAIKINTRLEPAKIDWLLRALAATSCPMSCPHGRPLALRYGMRDILKSFIGFSRRSLALCSHLFHCMVDVWRA
jgi:DNA mismatch repair protein MutL